MTTATDTPFISDIARGEQTAVLAWRHWLEERAEWGDAAAKARLEFCEVQEEIALQYRGVPAASAANDLRQDWLQEREAALLRAHEATWRASGPCEKCGDPGWSLRKVPGLKITAREGFNCKACFGTGDRGGLLRQFPIEDEYGAVRGESEACVHWSAGLPYAVECRLEDVLERVCFVCSDRLDRHDYCARCDANGARRVAWRVTEWAKSVVRWHPVERFVPVDVSDNCLDNDGVCWWWRDDVIHDHDPRLPAIIAPKGTYPTRSAANDALATTAGVLVRREVWGERVLA